MSIKKQYLKSKPVCKVTFRIPKKEAIGAKSVSIVGDFNSWNDKATPMKSFKNGEFTATIELEPNQEYHYKYLMDGAKWENDWNADKYIPSPFGNWDNSVVIT